MDRCALFVDAGYVLADSAMAIRGTRHREVSWDYEGLFQLLRDLATEHCGLPLLRCYWYDAAIEGRRTPAHDALADLPGLKLRLGRARPGRREHADAEIHRDLSTLARNHAIADAVIVTGDEDLAHVIADVQDLGVRVMLVQVAVEGTRHFSRMLRQECDAVIELDAAQLRPYAAPAAGAAPAPAPDRRAAARHTAGPAANGHAMAARRGVIPALPAGQHERPPAAYPPPLGAAEQEPPQPPAVSPHVPAQDAAPGRRDALPGLAQQVAGHGTAAPAPDVPARAAHAALPSRRAPAAGAIPAGEGPGDAAAHRAPAAGAEMEGSQSTPAAQVTAAQMPAAQVTAAERAGGADELAGERVPAAPAPEAGQQQPAGQAPGAGLARRELTVTPPSAAGQGPSEPAPQPPASPTVPRQEAAPPRQEPSRQHARREQPVQPQLYATPQPMLSAPPPVPVGATPALPSLPDGRHGVLPSGPAPATPAPSPPPERAAAPGQPAASPLTPSMPPQGSYGGPQQAGVPEPVPAPTSTLADAITSAHAEGVEFGESVARDAPALWLEAVLARKPRMPSDLEARLLQGSSLPIDFLLHDEVRHALRRGFWDALERARR